MSALDACGRLISRSSRLSPRYSLNRTLCGSQSRSGCFGVEKNTLYLSGFERGFVGYLALSSVTIATELSKHNVNRSGCVTTPTHQVLDGLVVCLYVECVLYLLMGEGQIFVKPRQGSSSLLMEWNIEVLHGLACSRTPPRNQSQHHALLLVCK